MKINTIKTRSKNSRKKLLNNKIDRKTKIYKKMRTYLQCEFHEFN